MKFVHIADCHLGAWRDPKMRDLTHKAWHKAVTQIIAEQPDFIILAGDFFNTALPSIESLKAGMQGLQKIKEANIPVYSIGGSHDYSPSGKTMLDVLEDVGLLKDVMRGFVENGKLNLTWTQDPKTGVKLAGILGKKGCLDRKYYEELNQEVLEKEEGEKIFLFHTSISELKPKHLEKMQAQPVSFLPKGCRYYAGGHVHIVADVSLPGYELVVYPGPIFPASFGELEKLSQGSYCVIEDWKMQRKFVRVKDTLNIHIKENSPTAIEQAVKKALNTDVKDKIILLRIEGELEGSQHEVHIKEFLKEAYEKGAYFIMQNTNKLVTKDFEEVQVSGAPDELEDALLKEHFKDTQQAKELMQILAQTTQEGEKKYQYEERVLHEATKILFD